MGLRPLNLQQRLAAIALLQSIGVSYPGYVVYSIYALMPALTLFVPHASEHPHLPGSNKNNSVNMHTKYPVHMILGSCSTREIKN